LHATRCCIVKQPHATAAAGGAEREDASQNRHSGRQRRRRAGQEILKMRMRTQTAL
jgi:hypothetical protein